MNINFIQDDNCTGCAACQDICPQHCIEMYRNNDGFLYPRILAPNTCIDCGLCYKVCPINQSENLTNMQITPMSFCLLHRNTKIWNASSSGGAFSAICQAYDDGNTIIYGAAFTDVRNVEHIAASGSDAIQPLRKSKYIQSNMSGIFSSIKNNLITGQKVLFSGTPCQVAAVKSYMQTLGVNCDRILFVDFVCHGVGSPAVFASFIDALEQREGCKLLEYSFRNKKMRNFNLHSYISSILFENGNLYCVDSDAYNKAFINKAICRLSCFTCKYARHERCSDITIADFKHVFRAFPSKDHHYNYSTVIFNTIKGNTLLPKLSELCYMDKCDIDFLYRNNPPLDHCPGVLATRDRFFAEYSKDTVNIIDLLYKYSAKEHAALKVWKLLPEKIRERIKGYLGR